ncbi:hypothetical protein [Pseudoalteromonas phenolica]|uniref:hypothetical protein n=1 Tax=Pseudoalteromonas phenolica TaxID=161398 RepID=UPI001F4F17C5|nr:hypothetical protein [Pseudoalteromonas phenolica]
MQSYLGGNILASLILNKADEWRDCGLVNQPIAQFPVEPIRTLGAYMVRNAIRRKEYAEDLGKQAKLWDIYLSKYSGTAAKVDTSVNK